MAAVGIVVGCFGASERGNREFVGRHKGLSDEAASTVAIAVRIQKKNL